MATYNTFPLLYSKLFLFGLTFMILLILFIFHIGYEYFEKFSQISFVLVTPILFRQLWILHGLVNGRTWVPIFYGLMGNKKLESYVQLYDLIDRACLTHYVTNECNVCGRKYATKSYLPIHKCRPMI